MDDKVVGRASGAIVSMAEVLMDGLLTLRLVADRYRAAQEKTMGHRLSVTAAGHATSVLLSVAFVLCVGAAVAVAGFVQPDWSQTAMGGLTVRLGAEPEHCRRIDELQPGSVLGNAARRRPASL